MDESRPSPPPGVAPLRLDRLSALPESVARPSYRRAHLRPGIVHIGLGNFHRAHQAWYLHRLLQAGEARDWAILGAGVRPYDARMRARLVAQDCLSTLIELRPEGARFEVTGAMVGYIPVKDGNGPLIAALSDPRIRIAALTVTEGGYYVDPVTGAFDAAHPDIRHDAARPDAPRTAFGAMVAALRHRRAAGLGPFAGQSCDNLRGNGAILRQTVVSLARLSDPALAEWIDANASFPDAMVDCIVPATGAAEIALAHAAGIGDAAPVAHEPFRQWVMEDDFCAGRPDWERVGAVFTGDVRAHETMKVRLLNAGHQMLANAGEILSIDTIAGCMAHPDIRELFRRVLTTEVAAHVRATPGCTASEYIDIIDRRFSNPRIRDTTRRVAFDGSARHAGFVLPTVRAALAAGAPVIGLALVEALWARMCFGRREDGSRIAPNDPFWDARTEAARAARDDPKAWLAQERIYGALADAADFADPFAEWHRLIWREGCAAALRAYATRTDARVTARGR